jgi:hypothetical protein
VSVNPILAQGEVGYETDTGKFKIGDGTNPWSTLPYAQITVNGVAVPIGGTSTSATNTITAAPTSHASTHSGAGTDPITGLGAVTMSGALAMGSNNITGVGTNITGTGAVTLASGGTTALSIDSVGAGTVNVGNTNATTISVGGGTTARSINIGTGAAAKTINIGTSDTTSSVTIASGSGGITLNDGAGSLTISGYGTGVLTADSSGVINSSSTLPNTLMPSGSILQVQSAVVSVSTASTSSTTPTNITGLSVTITPRSSSSKFLLSCMINTGYSATGGGWVYHNFARSGTNLVFTSGGTANTFANTRHVDNANMMTTSFEYLDSPATASSITYTVRWSVYSGHTAYLNRRGADAYFQGSSTFTVMEIA